MSLVEELFEEIESADENVVDEDTKAKDKPLPVFDSKSSKIKDNKEHFPLGTIKQAESALKKAKSYKRKPKWYLGSLDELKKEIISKVKKEYPTIEDIEKSTR